jgi:hypothetical protein
MNLRLTTVVLLGALIAVLIVACSTDSTPEEQSEIDSAPPTATFSPADATATWVAFKPEQDKIIAEILEQQSASATAIVATQLAMAAEPESEPTTDAAVSPDIPATPTQLAQRAIATAPVNRIAFGDGKGSIFTVNPDGSELKIIGDGSITSGEVRYTFPVWSPQGGSMLFSSFLIVGGAVSQSSLHRADADGNGEVVTLAVDPTSRSGIGPGVPHFSAWSPDGDRIALAASGEFGIGTMLLGSYSG